jgi:integrase
MAVFKKQGVYWIDYYVNGRRKRERIGPDKRLAETVLRKRKVEIAEGKFLERQRPITTTFDELAEAYLQWIAPDIPKGIPARKRSWKSGDVYAIGKLRAYFGGKRVTEIDPVLVEQYRAWRQSTISRLGHPVKPATINRELACLRHMFNVAIKGLLVLKGGVPTVNPVTAAKMGAEHNERDRVLSVDEFDRLHQGAADWLKPILLVAYHTGMRKGEILTLRWGQIDLKRGTIRLRSVDTKTGEGRIVPMNQAIRALVAERAQGIGQAPVFVNPETGKPYSTHSIAHAFQRACRKAEVKHATFHDLRHTFVTNARRAGIDYFRIMAITGHKTMAVFKRYNLVDEADLRQAMRQMDTYMDTTGKTDTAEWQVNA